MTYFEGFVLPVAEANEDAYRKHARDFAPLVGELGVGRMVEAWEADVPEGKVTDFRKAVDAKSDEKIVFSFFEYPSKQARDAANEKFMSDPRMQEMGANMPFDGKRMIIGGFEAIVDSGKSSGQYLNGFIVPVPRDKKDAYRAMTDRHAAIFREHGALRLVQGWGDDVPEGKVTDFRRAVKAQPDETVVFAFIEWPSKEASDQAWEQIMKDERFGRPDEAPFDGKRMFWGGFQKILDTAEQPVIEAGAPVTA